MKAPAATYSLKIYIIIGFISLSFVLEKRFKAANFIHL